MTDKKDLDSSVLNNTSELLSQCLNINNAYKIKHKELKEVYKAYKNLKEKEENDLMWSIIRSKTRD